MNEILTVSNEVEAPGSGLESVSSPDPELEFVDGPPLVVASLPGSPGEPSGLDASAPSLVLPGTEPIKRLPKRRSALESIIGEDERERITDTENAPWRMICSLVIRGATGSAVGTGWFAGPRTIVTAGHCVYHSMIGGWAREITIYPGRDSRRKPFGELKSRKFSTTNKWLKEQSPDFDYAAIHLGPEADEITKKTGWFSTAVLNDAALKSQRVNVSGYPGDKGIGELMGSEQWFHAKQIVYVTPYRIFYDVDTMGGQSGAPSWIQMPDGPKVVGIHAYGVGASVGANANSAPRITEDVLAVLKGWVEKA